MTVLDVVKAGALLSMGVMVLGAANRAVEAHRVPEVKAELDRAKILSKQLDREIDKHLV